MDSITSFNHSTLKKPPIIFDKSHPVLYCLSIPHFEKSKKLRKTNSKEKSTPTMFMTLAENDNEDIIMNSDSDSELTPLDPIEPNETNSNQDQQQQTTTQETMITKLKTWTINRKSKTGVQ